VWNLRRRSCGAPCGGSLRWRGAGVVGEGAIGLDLAAQHAEEVGEIVAEQALREGDDAGPVALSFGGGVGEEVAPGGYALHDFEEIADFEAFERGSFDTTLFEQRRGVEEAVEVEAAAAREEAPPLVGALLLGFDPEEVRAGLEREQPGAAERRKGVAGDMFAQHRPLQGGGAGLGKRGRDQGKQVRRVHTLYRMRPAYLC